MPFIRPGCRRTGNNSLIDPGGKGIAMTDKNNSQKRHHPGCRRPGLRRERVLLQPDPGHLDGGWRGLRLPLPLLLSKDEILLSIFRERWHVLLDRMDQINQTISEPGEKILAIIDFIFRSYQHNSDMMKC